MASATAGRISLKAATTLLERAMELLAKNDPEWQHASALEVQMMLMEPSCQERPFGHGQFSDFVKSRLSVIEIDKSSSVPLRLRLKV